MEILVKESLGSGLGSETRAALVTADVIIGIDRTTGDEFTVFGTPALESTVSMKKPAAMQTVRVPIDCATGELEKLLTIVRSLKGSEYQGSDE
jgi:hypothetical protein